MSNRPAVDALRILSAERTGEWTRLDSKRVLDLILAVFMLFILWPIMVVVAVAIKLEDSGPILFKQIRWGWRGRTFLVLKFRTMVSEERVSSSVQSFPGDDRITSGTQQLKLIGREAIPRQQAQ